MEYQCTKGGFAKQSVRMLNETIEDHQHPDIIHKAYIGGPYTDRFLTKKQKKKGERSVFYVDTRAIVRGGDKIVRTKFKQLFTANAFIKELRENPEVSVEKVEEMAKAQILLQGRSPEDDRRLREHNEDLMIEALRSAFRGTNEKEEVFKVLKYHLRDVTIMLRERIDSIPSYIEIE